ncbi:non-ribosomal peptide synthetase, partial [Streptosporangium sandarakinum]|uniref:non-ribosomal peptide synthetase n=1 Tax=Streptosporangium sandarakinum TaxID=1260955 RepID=UPI0033ADFD60
HDLMTITVRGGLDVAALERALAEVAARHPVLRTSFDLTGFSEPLQLVHDAAVIPLEVTDLRGDGARERLAEWREAEKRTGFDWTSPPLMRAHAHVLGDGEFAFSLSFHHAILDGWSVAALVTEILRRYTAVPEERAGGLAPPRAAFRDLVAAERAAVASERAREFWRERVADAPECRLPRLPGFPSGGPRAAEVLAVPVPAPAVAALERDARELRVPPRTILLTAYLLALGLVTGEREVMTGVLGHGRPESEGGGEVLGLFLNTLPLRVRLDAADRAELVRRVFDAEVAAVPYRHYPLFEIQRLAGRSPLLDTLFDFRDFHVYGGLPEDGPAVTGQEFFEQTDVPCTVAFVRVPGGGLTLTVSYDGAQFPRGQMEALAAHVLEAVTGAPRVGEADVAAITRWNATGRDHAGGTLHGLVLARAAAAPDAPAVGFAGEWITYRELARRAARVAAALRGAGVRAGEPVGVHLERSLDLPAALLGVLAAGGAYLPMEPGHPAGRLRDMLADAGASVVLTSAALAGQAPPAARTVTLPDGWDGEPLPADAADGPRKPTGPEPSTAKNATGPESSTAKNATGPESSTGMNATGPGPSTAKEAAGSEPFTGEDVPEDSLAYVIFTSGSTGRPKGVGISHRAIVNRLRWMQETYRLTPADRVLHKTPAGFDVSVWELFWPLITGAGLVVAEPGGHYDPGRIAELIAGEGVTTAHFVPSMLEAFLDLPEDLLRDLPGRTAGGLLRVVCSGEALPADLVRRFADRLPGVELHNLYGPTEAAVDVSWHRCDPAEPVVPIGRPVDNTRLEVLDERMARVPVGTPGQLFIGGVQLARGYLGRPALTAERFLPDPYGPPGSRLYATGDRARWRPDGELDYLGRL